MVSSGFTVRNGILEADGKRAKGKGLGLAEQFVQGARKTTKPQAFRDAKD